MRIVGIDPSLTGTGIASTAGWCTHIGQDGILKQSLAVRVNTLANLRHDIIEAVGTPDLVVIEAPSFRSLGGGSLERHALWWSLVTALCGRGVPVVEVTPAQLQLYATGRGVGGKAAVIDAVARRWPGYETKGDNNLCDAVVLAAMGADWAGQPMATVPATHRKALDKVAWPDGVLL